MASLISDAEKANINGIFNDNFDTFQRQIIVYKDPIKTVNAPDPSMALYGFGNSQTQESYSYTPVTGIFPALIRYQTLITRDEFRTPEDTNVKIPEGGCSIKVRQDARDYINNGKTDKIVVDGRTYYLDSDYRAAFFLLSQFWIFILKPTM